MVKDMDSEKIETMEADIAAAHQEINLLRCKLEATGVLFIIYVVMIALDYSNLTSIVFAFLSSCIYGIFLWKKADKPFERLMNS